MFAAGEHGELQQQVQLGAVECVVDHLALLEQLAVPQIDELLTEARLHLVTEDGGRFCNNVLLVRRAEQLERVCIDVDDADFAHAAVHELLVHVDEDAQIGDALRAHLVDQPFDAGEILHPERHRRMHEQAARVVLAADQQAARILAVGDVLDRQQHPFPALFVTGHDGCLELDVEPVAVERVVNRIAEERGIAVPELHQFLDMGLQHVVAKHAVEIGDQVREVGGGEQFQGLAVDLAHADAASAFLHAPRMAGQVLAQRGHPGAPPGLEQRLHRAVVLEP